MTDKEIIIDGVNVSECEYRNWQNFCCCDNSKENEGEERITGIGGCEYNPNCYFKQLKRKEQECEELKQWKKDAENLFRTQTDNADKIINRYKQALDEIEEYINSFPDFVKEADKIILDIIKKVKAVSNAR